jgi:DNA (cytosine-5)-methyltransferase 1
MQKVENIHETPHDGKPLLGAVHSPKCLDLFCCAGGAGMGYKQAGFDVTGIDIEPQPKYPFKFILSDAITYLKEHGKEYDFIHASPPCQGYSHLTPKEHKGNYEKLIDVLRELLNEIGKPYCIENVAGAKNELKNPTMLCGSMFNLRTQRHRFFETSFPLVAPCNCDHIAYDNDPVKGRVKTFRLLADNGAVYHETIASTLHYAIFMCVGEYCKNWLIFNNVLKKAIGARHDLPRASNARQTP